VSWIVMTDFTKIIARIFFFKKNIHKAEGSTGTRLHDWA